MSVKNKNAVPLIVIPGFCQSKIDLVDEKGNFIKRAWPPKVDIKKAAKAVLPSYIKTVITRKDKGFSKAVGGIFSDVLELIAVNPDGEYKHNVRPVRDMRPMSEFTDSMKGFVRKIAPVRTLSEMIGEENIFLFSYNAFGKPEQTAHELEEFIENVRKTTGSEKVDLLPYSLGGPLSLAYFHMYGDKNEVRRLLYMVPALDGSELISDIMDRKVDRKQGYSLLEFIFSQKVSDLFRKVLAFVPWDVRYKVLYEGLDVTERLVLRNSPFMWSLIPTEKYGEISERLLSDGEHGELRKMTDGFFEVRKNAREILIRQKDRGTGIFICAGYGRRLLDLCLDGSISSDGIIALTSASLGAKAMPLDRTDDTKAISPETGIFPDRTWFIKELNHVRIVEGNATDKLTAAVFTSKDNITVDTYSELTQFLTVNI